MAPWGMPGRAAGTTTLPGSRPRGQRESTRGSKAPGIHRSSSRQQPQHGASTPTQQQPAESRQQAAGSRQKPAPQQLPPPARWAAPAPGRCGAPAGSGGVPRGGTPPQAGPRPPAGAWSGACRWLQAGEACGWGKVVRAVGERGGGGGGLVCVGERRVHVCRARESGECVAGTTAGAARAWRQSRQAGARLAPRGAGRASDTSTHEGRLPSPACLTAHRGPSVHSAPSASWPHPPPEAARRRRRRRRRLPMGCPPGSRRRRCRQHLARATRRPWGHRPRAPER